MPTPIKEPINGITYEEREILGNHASYDSKRNIWYMNYINSSGSRMHITASNSFSADREGGLLAIQELKNKAQEKGLVQTTVRGKSCLKQLDSTHHDQPPQHAEPSQAQYTQTQELRTVLPNGRHPLPNEPRIKQLDSTHHTSQAQYTRPKTDARTERLVLPLLRPEPGF